MVFCDSERTLEIVLCLLQLSYVGGGMSEAIEAVTDVLRRSAGREEVEGLLESLRCGGVVAQKAIHKGLSSKEAVFDDGIEA